MKKFLSILLAAMLLVSFAACGETGLGDNEIADLINDGFSTTMTSYCEDYWKGVFQKGDSYGTVYLAEIPFTKADYDKLSAIPSDEEDSEDKINAVLTNFDNVTVTDITDRVPSEEELNKYVGKTLGDLEADGFDNSGNSNYEGVYEFYYDGPVYSCRVFLEDGVLIENMDDYSVNDLRQLKIGKVEFAGFSFGILEE